MPSHPPCGAPPSSPSSRTSSRGLWTPRFSAGLAAREGLDIGPDFIPQLRDVAARIAELLFLFGQADAILERTLDDSLTRSALGMAGPEDGQENDGAN